MRYILIFALLFLSGCKDKKQSSKTNMKCGAGKCGANMSESSTRLEKRRIKILKQMKSSDEAQECVKGASSMKELYGCLK